MPPDPLASPRVNIPCVLRRWFVLNRKLETTRYRDAVKEVVEVSHEKQFAN